MLRWHNQCRGYTDALRSFGILQCIILEFLIISVSFLHQLVMQEGFGLRKPWISLRGWHIVPLGDPCRPNCAATLTRKSPHGPVSSSMTTVRARLDRILFLNNKTLISLFGLSFTLSPLSMCISCKKGCGCWRGAYTIGLCRYLPWRFEWKKRGLQSWLSADDAGKLLILLFVSSSVSYFFLDKNRVSIYLILNRTSVSQREKILEKSTLNREIDQNCWIIVEF